MPFHPLPLSVRIGGSYNNLPTAGKVAAVPIMVVAITVVFALELLILPCRWIGHELTHHYSDRDESEWRLG